MKFSRIAALILCIILLCSAAFAEFIPTEKIHDLEIMVGASTYAFPMSIAQAKAAGIVFDDEAAIYADEKIEGRYLRSFPAGNGVSAFKLTVMCLPEGAGGNYNENTLYVAGMIIENDVTEAVELAGGLKLGVSTYEDCTAVLGEPYTVLEGNSRATFRLNHDLAFITLDFKDGVLSVVNAYTTLGQYGLEFSPAAPDAELPDYASMTPDQFILNGKLYSGELTYADLAKDGWAMDYTLAADTLEPSGSSYTIWGVSPMLYNGESMLQAFLYNPAETGTCTTDEGTVRYLVAFEGDGTELILANGLTIGSTYDEVTAALGTDATVTEKETYTFYEYKDDETGAGCGFRIADGKVIYVRMVP